jgi:hypothetical protein
MSAAPRPDSRTHPEIPPTPLLPEGHRCSPTSRLAACPTSRVSRTRSFWHLTSCRRTSLPRADSGTSTTAPATLATAAAGYYRQALDEGLTPSAQERSRYEAVLKEYQRMAAVDLQSAAERRRLTTEESRRLAALWPERWLSLEAALPGRTPALLEVRRRVTGMTE